MPLCVRTMWSALHASWRTRRWSAVAFTTWGFENTNFREILRKNFTLISLPICTAQPRVSAAIRTSYNCATTCNTPAIASSRIFEKKFFEIFFQFFTLLKKAFGHCGAASGPDSVRTWPGQPGKHMLLHGWLPAIHWVPWKGHYTNLMFSDFSHIDIIGIFSL